MKAMKSTILTILILLGTVLSLKSQDFWEQLYFPDSTAIYCIAVNDQGNIFVGAAYDGVSGGVYRSMDTAQTWELVLDLGDFSVLSIAINVNGDLYIGKTGFDNFMVSQDNGNNWDAIELPSNANVMKILCLQDTIYVSLRESNGALVIRSIDRGQTWDSVFTTTEHSSEYVSDFAVSNSGDIYISLMCYFADMGGVYKSEDGGDTWEYVGLINHQVYSVEFNSNDDLFIGVWGDFIYSTGGLYALYNGSDSVEELIFGPSVTEMVINSDDDIYFADVPSGIIRSKDNGQTFEYVNEGLSGEVGRMSIDSQGFIYLASIYSSNELAKSINPTITEIKEPLISGANNILIIPNPAKDYMNVIIPNDLVSNNSYTISIYDISGKIVHHEIMVSWKNSFPLDISNLIPGSYFIRVLNENSSLTSKFIKE